MRLMEFRSKWQAFCEIFLIKQWMTFNMRIATEVPSKKSCIENEKCLLQINIIINKNVLELLSQDKLKKSKWSMGNRYQHRFREHKKQPLYWVRKKKKRIHIFFFLIPLSSVNVKYLYFIASDITKRTFWLLIGAFSFVVSIDLWQNAVAMMMRTNLGEKMLISIKAGERS